MRVKGSNLFTVLNVLSSRFFRIFYLFNKDDDDNHSNREASTSDGFIDKVI